MTKLQRPRTRPARVSALTARESPGFGTPTYACLVFLGSARVIMDLLALYSDLRRAGYLKIVGAEGSAQSAFVTPGMAMG